MARPVSGSVTIRFQIDPARRASARPCCPLTQPQPGIWPTPWSRSRIVDRDTMSCWRCSRARNVASDSGATPGRGTPSGPVSGRRTRLAITEAVNASRWPVASVNAIARARVTRPSLICSRTGPTRSGSHAVNHTRRWHWVIGRPVATWISAAAAERQVRRNRLHSHVLGGLECDGSGSRGTKSVSNSATIAAVASMETASAHALTASTASTTANACPLLTPDNPPGPAELSTKASSASSASTPAARPAGERTGAGAGSATDSAAGVAGVAASAIMTFALAIPVTPRSPVVERVYCVSA